MSSTACAMSDLEFWTQCAFLNAASTMFKAVAFLQLPEVHIHRDNIIEHLGVSSGQPVFELAVASADHTHLTRTVSGLQSLRRSPSLLGTVVPFVVLTGLPNFGECSRCPSGCAQGHRSSCSRLSCPNSRESQTWPQFISTHVDHHITHSLMLSQTFFSGPRMSRRILRSHRCPFVIFT